jgi:2-polyprenyl-3-methyl-5-hydroxy-6-metoxy-1,4-benzoquinol methylase
MAPVKTWSTPERKESQAFVPCALCGGEKFELALSCGGFSYVRCLNCELVQINPQPFIIDVESRYKELHGNDYLAYEIENEAAFLELQKLALKDIGFDRIEKQIFAGKGADKPLILDAGCATGAMLEVFKNSGWQAVGVEISPAAEYARQKRGLDVYSITLESCNFSSGLFDVIHASHFLEHLNSPDMFLFEAMRLLRPGGYIILTTPNISGFQARLFGSRWRSVIFDHLYLFSKKTIKAMLGNIGFNVEKTSTWGGLAAGTAPLTLKRIADKAVKILGTGDVMVVRARKPLDQAPKKSYTELKT